MANAAGVIKSIAITLALLVVLNVNDHQVNGADNVLYSGETLYAGNYLRHKSYTFICQVDCNLVLYDNGNPIWASNTGGLSHNCYCAMQKDGNFVVYKPGGSPIWASNTHRPGSNPYYVLILQKDRNVVIYGPPIFATHTNARVSEGVTISASPALSCQTNATTEASLGTQPSIIAGPGISSDGAGKIVDQDARIETTNTTLPNVSSNVATA